jgi:hypothetical protein
MPANKSPKLMRRAEVSSFLKDQYGLTRSAATLAVDRCRGRGPVFAIIDGRAYYHPADVAAWAEAQISAAKPMHPRVVHRKKVGRPRKIISDGAVA